MSISVRFFASLGEELGTREKSIEYHAPLTIEDIWADVSNRPVP